MGDPALKNGLSIGRNGEEGRQGVFKVPNCGWVRGDGVVVREDGGCVVAVVIGVAEPVI